MLKIISTILLLAAGVSSCKGFTTSNTQTICFSTKQISSSYTRTHQLGAQASRRESLRQIAFGISALIVPQKVMAGAEKEPTIYKSGKTPIVPGQKPKDKNDVSGTRKDPGFLRSLSNCKSQCETTTGSDGFARSKEECLSDCQDVCCTTYEQCTFGIVPRM